MKKALLLFMACLAITNTSAQSTIDEVFATLKPNNSMSFYTINSNIYGLDYADAIVRKYDKEWHLLETHDAHQETYNSKYSQSASQGSKYNSELSKYQLKEWEDREASFRQNKRYSFSTTNFNEFWQGDESKLYYIKQTHKMFISSHSVYKYGDNYNGIEGEISSTSNYYQAFVTDFEFIDWDGNKIQTIILPYYVDYASPQFINVDDKSYIVIGANKIYKKNIPEDWELHSGTEYNIEDREVEPDVYHHFVLEYVKETNEVRHIKTFTSSKEDKKEIAVFDLNGKQLSSPQPGVNLILYSDGTSKKVMMK